MPRFWTTDRLLLRQLTPEDADMVSEYGARSREYHRAWEPLRTADFWTRTRVAERLAHELQHAAQDRGLALWVSQAALPDRVVGRVALNNIVRGAFQSCSVGYGLAPDATGRGYMTEALNAVVAVAFDDLRLHRVEANVIPRNARSIAVAERCGFEREGMSPRFLRIAGRWEDHLRLARLNADIESAE